MDWGALGLVVAGGVLTIVGGFISQWWSGRQADAREVRDRANEQRVWARQLRYEAHIGFLNDLDHKFQRAEVAFALNGDPNVPEDYLVPLYDRLTALQVVSEQKTIDAAEKTLGQLRDFVFGPKASQAVDFARGRYLVAMREEFGLTAIRTFEDEINDEIAAQERAAIEQQETDNRDR